MNNKPMTIDDDPPCVRRAKLHHIAAALGAPLAPFTAYLLRVALADEDSIGVCTTLTAPLPSRRDGGAAPDRDGGVAPGRDGGAAPGRRAVPAWHPRWTQLMAAARRARPHDTSVVVVSVEHGRKQYATVLTASPMGVVVPQHRRGSPLAA